MKQLLQILFVWSLLMGTSFGQVQELHIERWVSEVPLERFNSIEFGGPSEWISGTFAVRLNFLALVNHGCTNEQVYSRIIGSASTGESERMTITFKETLPNGICTLLGRFVNVIYTQDYLPLNRLIELVFTDEIPSRRPITVRFRIVEDGKGGHRLADVQVE